MDTLTSFFRSLDACAWREFNMAAYLVCLTTDGGIPLFTRTKGNLPQLPFPVIGSLNGVCMFASNQDASLLNTVTDDAKVVWKVFHEKLLEFVFNSMVLLLGIDELTNIRNVELLKRDLRCCYSLIDSFLEGTSLTGNITKAVDVILCSDVSVLQEFLDDFASAVNSQFGCLLVMGKVAVATERWWELTGLETVLLSFLVRALPPCSSRDIPVYLPYGSPKYLDQYWRLAVDMLKSSRRSHPRNLPGDIVLDMGILGYVEIEFKLPECYSFMPNFYYDSLWFLLVNRDERKCLSSVHPSGVMTGVDSQSNLTGGGMSIAKRKSILVSFYKSVVGTLFPPHELAASLTDEPSSELHSSLPHQAMETYMCSNDHKCYAIRNATHELYLLFAADVPNYALGSVASNTLNVLTKGKLV
ncbi:Protein fuzzy-like protein [Acropora cervicornis]|uniref:Protein fuzzy-like protein n=1 Tax=Acropora cervicornis TaxID=6130 RepID=A0AAD9QXF2_ACRCE|nr:Protein fuzzy-like protein [Acropora cervicornis]